VLRLHDAPEGPTSITGTARLALAIFYIVITPLSGHTQVEVAKNSTFTLAWQRAALAKSGRTRAGL